MWIPEIVLPKSFYSLISVDREPLAFRSSHHTSVGRRRRGRGDRSSLTRSLSSLKGNTPFPFVFEGWSGVTVVFVDVRNDVLLGCQERSGLRSNLSRILKCVDGTRPNDRVLHVRSEGWVRNTQFDDVVPR